MIIKILNNNKNGFSLDKKGTRWTKCGQFFTVKAKCDQFSKKKTQRRHNYAAVEPSRLRGDHPNPVATKQVR